MSRSSSRKKPFEKNRARLDVETLESRVTPSGTPIGTISGFVYGDTNNNGSFDAGEPPVAGSTIVLINNSNNQVAGTTTTAADGSYSFTTDGTVAGPEQQTQPQSVTIPQALTNFTQAGALPQFDPSLGTLDKVVITESGTITSNIQAENTSPVADTIDGTVSGTFSLSAPGVTNDLLTITGQPNSAPVAGNPSDDTSFSGPSSITWDGLSASGTNAIPAITDPASLQAYEGTGTVAFTETANATSDASDQTANITDNIQSWGAATVTVTYYYHTPGALQFNTSYTVEQPNLPSGYTIPGLNSQNGTILPYNPTPPEEITNIIVTPQNPVAPNNNFGELNPASIAGVAYVQSQANQTYDPGTTPPLAGVTMTLTGGNLTTPLTTTTAADGTYSFTGLVPGNYSVTQTQPAAYLPGTITAGTDSGTVGTEQVSQVQLNSADTATGYNFGELNLPSISGFVYTEPNAPTQTLYQDQTDTPGIQGATVTLKGSDGSSQTMLTDANGAYSFSNLNQAVTYTVTLTHPSGYLAGTDTAGSNGGTVSPTSEEIDAISLAGTATATGYNFGELLPSSLAGNVYVDAQNDGQLDPGDPPIAGDTITLTGFSDLGPVSLTTKTAADGSYSFNNLRPGTYALVQAPVTGYTDGATTVGSQGGTGSDENISSISLAPAVAGVNNNFGELQASQPGNPLPKNVIPLGQLPIISKVQLTSIPEPVALNPQLHGQMAFVVGTTMTLTGQQLTAVQALDAVNSLDNGLSSQAYVSQVYTSQAARALQVNNLYESILGRAPTAQEQSAAISQLNSGSSSLTLMQSLYTSTEFQQAHPSSQALATALSQDILNVTPGTVSSQSLVQSMGNEPLSTVVNTMLTSTQSVGNLIDNVYLEVLRRDATAAEIQTWTAPIQAGTMTLDQLAQRLLTSQEFYQLAYNSVN